MENEKSDPKYWDDRVLGAKGDPQALVYAAAGKLENCQRIGDELIRMIVKPGQRFLDVGCGFGRYYPAVVAAGGRYTGIDFSEEMIKEARKRYPEGRFFVSDWMNFDKDLSLEDIIFESICHSSTDFSLEEFKEYLMKNLVKEGGKLIMVEPGMCGVFSNGNLFD